MRSVLSLVAVVLGLVGINLGAVAASAAPTPAPAKPVAAKPGKKLCVINNKLLDELSGMVATKTGYVVINDGSEDSDAGDREQIFFLDKKCKVDDEVSYSGGGPRDTEDLALSPDGTTLWIADIGDNSTNKKRRESVALWSMPVDGSKKPVIHRLTYPDGPHDAEALLVDPSTGRLLVATKALGGAGLYRAPPQLVTEDAGTNRLERVADVPPLVTDGAFLPDGRFVLRSYTTAYVYDRPGHQVASAPLPRQPQGESVAAAGGPSGSPGSLLVGSEGKESAVYRVPVPGDAADESSTAAAAQEDSDPPGRRPADDPWWQAGRVVRAAVALVALVGGVAVLRRRRRR